MTDYGVCTNPQCARSASADRVERYPGPGQYCPDCGELLRAEPAPDAPRATRSRPWRSPLFGRRPLVAGAAALSVALIATGIVVAQPAIRAFGVRVCTTTMTDRIGSEIVRRYAPLHGDWPFHFAVVRATGDACEVRFRAAATGPDDAVIARDGIVAVVNPQNPVSRLTSAQLRDVLAGRITDWSQLGGPPGAIAAIAPENGSDTAAMVTERVMQGQPYGDHVARAASADTVRTVASPSGVRSIGIVPFSAAVPAKVLALDNAPPPSPLSIGDERYPLSVRIMADSDFRHPPRLAAGLIAFARSNDAQELVVRSALISKNGT